jgi:hypothetical protein
MFLAWFLVCAACSKSKQEGAPANAAPSTPSGAVVRSPIRIDLPDRTGWKAYPTGSSTLLMLVGPHGEMLTAKPFDHEPTAADLRERITGADDVRIGDADPHEVHANTSGEKVRGWMHALACGDWVLLYFFEADDAKPPAGSDLVMHVRCLAAGEPDIAWPST